MSDGHKIPLTNDTKSSKYYKWHNSWSHNTNNRVLQNVIHKAITEGWLKFPERNKGVLTIDKNPFQDNSVNITMLEDLMQQPLESSTSDCKEMPDESIASSKRAASAEKKAMSTGSGASSKSDHGKGADRKGKAIIVEQAREKPEPQTIDKRDAKPTTRRLKKTILITVREDCLLLHCSQYKEDNVVAYKLDYKHPA